MHRTATTPPGVRPPPQDQIGARRHRRRSRLFWALVVTGVWTLIGLWVANQYLLRRVLGGYEIVSWTQPFLITLPDVWLWAAFTPGIIWLARRFRPERERLPRVLVAHTLAALGIHSLDVTLDTLLLYPLLLGAPAPRAVASLVAQANVNIVSYAVIVTVIWAVDYYRAYRSREVAAARLEAELAQAQLQLLRGQLHPHFLFNTLNAISALMHTDVEKADRVLVRLSELLRLAIDADAAQEVPLCQELSFVRGYLEIVEARFPDRIHTRFAVQSSAYDALVPQLILQPLVENAVRHGIGSRRDAGHIEICAQRQNGALRLTVSDDGPGLDGDPERELTRGVGLRNTRERLLYLYGSAQGFHLGRSASGGLEVALTIPYRLGAPPRRVGP